MLAVAVVPAPDTCSQVRRIADKPQIPVSGRSSRFSRLRHRQITEFQQFAGSFLDDIFHSICQQPRGRIFDDGFCFLTARIVKQHIAIVVENFSVKGRSLVNTAIGNRGKAGSQFQIRNSLC